MASTGNGNVQRRLRIRERREIVARMYLTRHTQAEIALECGVTQQQISSDIKAIHKQWRESTLINYDEAKRQELDRIDRLEETYWVAWRQSLEEREITSAEQTNSADGAKTKTGIRKEKRDGNAQYLAGIQWCINKRAEILGLDAPQKISMTTDFTKLSDEELIAVVEGRKLP